MNETRKTVLFIVEGSTDKTALESIFKTIYRSRRNIEFKFAHGDISSDEATTVDNVESKIEKIIRDFCNDKKLRKSDIYQVIQIFDMDGAYIPDKSIKIGDTKAFFYSLEEISCKEPSRVIERNNRKRLILEYLKKKHVIKGYPYEMYFMSCNLDHALYNMNNLDGDQKQIEADSFYEKFIGKEISFPEFLRKEVVNGTPDSYYESWSYITEGVRSLERHTNLHIYFNNNPIC